MPTELYNEHGFKFKPKVSNCYILYLCQYSYISALFISLRLEYKHSSFPKNLYCETRLCRLSDQLSKSYKLTLCDVGLSQQGKFWDLEHLRMQEAIVCLHYLLCILLPNKSVIKPRQHRFRNACKHSSYGLIIPLVYRRR